MRRITATGGIAGTQAPAVGPVAAIVVRIAQAVVVVDARVIDVLLPVIGVPVTQPARVETAEREMREEQRPAGGGSG